MPCFGDREKGEVRVEEKWDYIVSGFDLPDWLLLSS